jgi:hypothetical protein
MRREVNYPVYALWQRGRCRTTAQIPTPIADTQRSQCSLERCNRRLILIHDLVMIAMPIPAQKAAASFVLIGAGATA